ncbi:MAG: ferrous iron transport protein A [Endomicrobium sp.]|jgi:Fe2+ transport system protein FeoA|nr:ferrous iron transport protein A [Endomicrobium sp.]
MLKKFIKNIYNNWHKRWTKRYLKKFDEFNSIFKNNNTITLSTAVPGVYKCVLSNTSDKKLNTKLIEIGFIPGVKLRVIKNTGKKGFIILKIKGSKIALSNKITDKILVKGKS